MFKRFLIFSLLAFFCLTGSVAAQPDIGLGTAGNIAKEGGLSTSGATETALAETIGRYVSIVLGFTGIIFLLLTLYAGFLWMTAGGDEGNIEKAKSILTSSVIGLAIVILSYSITALIMYFIAGTTKPEPYGELEPTGPSQYSGCCFVATPGCNKKIGVGAAAYNVPCGDCYENQGQKNCQNVSGAWFTNTCAKAQNDFEFRCDAYKGVAPD